MSTFRSSALRLMPPQLRERVGKWTHEPRSNLNHKKHLSDAFTHTFISSTILFRKYKNIFTFLHTQPKPKNTITASYLLYCIVFYFIAFVIIFRFTYFYTLCLTTTRWSWGHKTRRLFCRLLEEGRAKFFWLFWYVSNVSMIFDAPCLFLHHLLSVSLHFVAFLCIFRN
jgi:hypothetical protein